MYIGRFYRNVSSLDSLLKRMAQTKGVIAQYVVIKEINLDKITYFQFVNNFDKSYEFLYKYRDKAIIKNDVWNCIKVCSEGEREILVVMNQYVYPRYVGITQQNNGMDLHS